MSAELRNAVKAIDTLQSYQKLLADPKHLAAMGEEARKQLQLTDEQQKKYDEATSTISGAKTVQAALDRRSKELDDREAALELRHETLTDEETDYIKRRRSLDAAINAHSASLAELKDREQKLNDIGHVLRQREDAVAAREKDLNAQATDLAAREEKIQGFATTLVK